jgi:hypothetical protein
MGTIKAGAEKIYGDEAKNLLELRTVEKYEWFSTINVEEYNLKPGPSICFYCPFYEKRFSQ